MKRALIIGAAGFVGGYLIDYLLKEGTWSVSATKMPFEAIENPGASVYDLNLLEPESVKKLLAELRPEYIFHLAAQSSVAVSWKKPDLTVDVNIKGTLYLLEALRQLDYHPRVLLIGSGEEYGHIRQGEVPITEENNTRPGNIYAATKVCQNLIGKIYSDAYGLDIMSTRSFNHTGPNQSPVFVVADFCRQVAELEKLAEKGETPEGGFVIHVGNLSARRDFTDVRDVVRAYSLLVCSGKAGETYNVGTGHAVRISEILDMILRMAKIEIRVETDPARFRPVDVPIIEPDIEKLQKAVNWQPEIPLERTIAETLEYWRNRL